MSETRTDTAGMPEDFREIEHCAKCGRNGLIVHRHYVELIDDYCDDEETKKGTKRGRTMIGTRTFNFYNMPDTITGVIVHLCACGYVVVTKTRDETTYATIDDVRAHATNTEPEDTMSETETHTGLATITAELDDAHTVIAELAAGLGNRGPVPADVKLLAEVHEAMTWIRDRVRDYGATNAGLGRTPQVLGDSEAVAAVGRVLAASSNYGMEHEARSKISIANNQARGITVDPESYDGYKIDAQRWRNLWWAIATDADTMKIVRRRLQSLTKSNAVDMLPLVDEVVIPRATER